MESLLRQPLPGLSECEDGRRWHFFSVRPYNHFRGNKDGPLRCEPCGKVFKNMSSWRQHQYYQHRSHKRFPCDYCGKSFTTKWYQGQHILNVHRAHH